MKAKKSALRHPSIFILLLSLFLIAHDSPLPAQSGSAGTTGMAFLKIGVGGRASALGEAVVADAPGAMAAYWNPAGVASSEKEILFAHSEWLQDIRNEYLAVKFRGLGSGWALSLQWQSIGGIMQRSKPTPEPTTEITAHDVAFGLSYGRTLRPDLEVGATVKYLGESIVNYAANGFAVDAGLRYRVAAFDGLTVAASLHNLGSVEKLRSEKIKLPAMLRAGFSYKPGFTLGAGQLTILAAMNKIFSGDTLIGFGGEIVTQKIIALRAGYQLGRENQSFAGGIGLSKGSYRLDYAYVPFSSDLGNTHRLSLAIGL